ncbi:lipid phosphate phosphatase 1 [Roridomyces roridus]|uniref:Lipid phosphate phosphatase 1 n=1 Tax=Roridomyces roridus TaxID=1738132 RepID=A0AAD7BJE2_9AGAR|nr:lipid phosphate phosphatase 1 [Roridomyces roridus]
MSSINLKQFALSYLTDWSVVAAFWILSELANHLPVFERDFSLSDTLISHPHKPSQITGTVNHFIALLVPAAILLVASLLQRSFFAFHNGLLALLAGRGMARLFTNVLKARVGRLRPDFLARCKWNEIAQKCTGKAATVLDGRKSFPSGHSSAAFAGMAFLSFWLAGQTAGWCFQVPVPAASIRSSRLARLSVTLMPLCWAVYVAVTRLEDYRHHKEDVLAGAAIGIVCAAVYLAFWPSPLSVRSFASHTYGQPRQLHEGDERRRGTFDMELTRLEDDMDA